MESVTGRDVENTNKNLFKLSMKDKWNEVVDIYKEDKKARTARITRSGDTALHVAVSDGKDNVVEQLVKLIGEEQQEQREEALRIQNERGNTALHFAASIGSVQMCQCIASAEPSLLSIRNFEGETPLFLAALNGRKEAFLSLHYIWLTLRSPNASNHYSTCRRNDGETILHCAIAGDYFVIHPMTRVLNPKLSPPKDQTGNQRDIEASEKMATNGAETKSSGSETREWSHPLFPDNYKSCVDFFKFVFLVLLVIFGKGSTIIKRISRKKEKHVWSAQIMDQLLLRASMYEYDDSGNKPQQNLGDKAQESTVPYAFEEGGDVTLASITDKQANQQKNGDEKNIKGEMLETPILLAAKNGVTEMVEKILELFPVAIHDMDAKKKNIVLLAVENRQNHLYEFLLKRKILKESIFRKVDNEGNSALHLAAKLGDIKPWLIPGEALQMHWEIKWYLYVKGSMPPHFFRRYNNQNKTPREIFSETHKNLLKSGVNWLNKTSESCSVVAALIATVAFATSSTVPGGVQEGTGTPTLEDKPAFNAFAISSLIALCCSVTSVVLFLSILTSRYQESDFGKNLPRKLIFGLTNLFASITSMLVSFCAGHFFVLKDKLKYAAFPLYTVICLPVTLFALAQFPLYFDLIWATFKKVPQHSYRTTLH